MFAVLVDHVPAAAQAAAIALDPTGAARRLGSLVADAPADHASRGQTTVERGYYRIATVPHRGRGGGNEPIGVQRLHELDYDDPLVRPAEPPALSVRLLAEPPGLDTVA